eukprot:7697706-Pyramimonas_sp.AAC.1
MVDEAMINQYLDEHIPEYEAPQLPTPSMQALAGALRRAKPSAPGPDRLPASAWLLDERLLQVLYSVMVGLFAGRVPPWGLNFSNLAFVPKGDEPADAVDVVRGAGQVRPLTMKNTDVKAMTTAANHELAKVIGERAHPVQQGFIRGRSFLHHIVSHDAYGRAASHHSEMIP